MMFIAHQNVLLIYYITMIIEQQDYIIINNNYDMSTLNYIY